MLTNRKIKTVFQNIPVIETPRLILRKISESDARDMYEYSCLESVTKYLTWMPHSSIKETERYIKLLEKRYRAGAFWDFGLEYRENSKFIGTCGFTSFNISENSAEIGYVLAPGYWGKKLASEAAHAVMNFGFSVFGLDFMCARFIEGNISSSKVMSSLGMTFENIYKNSMYIKGEYKTIIEYKITKDTFMSKNNL